MTRIILFLSVAGAVGLTIGRFVDRPSRRFLAGLWCGAPSLLVLGNALIQGGSEMLLLSSPWALLILLLWGTPALLGFAIGSIRRQATLDA